MTTSKTQLSRPVIRWSHEVPTVRADELVLIAEEPLSIRVQGRPFVVVMRTPGEEKAHAAGLCLAEGVIDRPEDIAALALCDGAESNTVTVTLHQNAAERFAHRAPRRAHVSQTGCGLCGKELIADLYQDLSPLPAGPQIAAHRAAVALRALDQHQPLRAATRAAHAAAVFDGASQLLAVAEDVGRHNALDKAVGRLFLDGRLKQSAMLVMSSRISYELVQKAARARAPIILGNSRPTALAVALADRLNMTLATRAPGGGLLIFSHAERLPAAAAEPVAHRGI